MSEALVGGYRLAFVIGALFALAAATLGAVLLRAPRGDVTAVEQELAIETT